MPAPFVKDSAIEAIDSGVKLVVIITEGVPTLDMLVVKEYLKGKDVQVVGPNCPGVITQVNVRLVLCLAIFTSLVELESSLVLVL